MNKLMKLEKELMDCYWKESRQDIEIFPISSIPGQRLAKMVASMILDAKIATLQIYCLDNKIRLREVKSLKKEKEDIING